MVRARTRIDAALATEQTPDVIELYSSTRATVRRLQHELALDERVRRQLRLAPPAAARTGPCPGTIRTRRHSSTARP